MFLLKPKGGSWTDHHALLLLHQREHKAPNSQKIETRWDSGPDNQALNASFAGRQPALQRLVSAISQTRPAKVRVVPGLQAKCRRWLNICRRTASSSLFTNILISHDLTWSHLVTWIVRIVWRCLGRFGSSIFSMCKIGWQGGLPHLRCAKLRVKQRPSRHQDKLTQKSE